MLSKTRVTQVFASNKVTPLRAGATTSVVPPGHRPSSAVPANSGTATNTAVVAVGAHRQSLTRAPTTNMLHSSSIHQLKQAVISYKPGRLDIWALGITIVIGGQYFSWNAGLSAGLYSYTIAYFLVGTAYICLVCCTAEITGALPFAGGAYGLSRCTLGFYPGFLIGCCETFEYIAYVASTTIALSDMLIASTPSWKGYDPLIWLLFYLSALFFHVRGNRLFWIFNLIIAFVSLAVLLVFCLGSLKFVDQKTSMIHNQEQHFAGGGREFMRVLPLAAWFFVGVEALNLASDDVDHPKKQIPVAQVSCVVTLFCTGLMTLFVCAALPAREGVDALPKALAPLNFGFEPMLKISGTNATLLSIPATYATSFGFMWCYGRLIQAMATSRLLPPFLARTSTKHGTPSSGVLFGTTISFLLCVVVYVERRIGNYLFAICITAAFMAYIAQCIGYISLRRNFRNIKSSTFRSPFGIYGAVYAICIWVLGVISIVAFQGNRGIEISMFLVVVVLLTIFYYVYARKRQTFSAQENKVLLVAHVMKFNANRVRHKNVSPRPGSNSKHSQGHSRLPGAVASIKTSIFSHISNKRSAHSHKLDGHSSLSGRS